MMMMMMMMMMGVYFTTCVFYSARDFGTTFFSFLFFSFLPNAWANASLENAFSVSIRGV